MRPLKLRIRGVGPFTEAGVNFANIPGPLIAVTGLNGEGKTMFLESIFASIYRMLPSRPVGIYKYCLGKDSQIEYEFDFGGDCYKSIVNINAPKQVMESFLYKNGSPLTSGKNTEFDSACSELFGSSKQILASVFACQKKRGSFITLSKADRKSLFISMLGLQRLEEISKLAGAKAAKLKSEVDSLSGAIKVVSEIASLDLPDTQCLTLDIESLVAEVRKHASTVSSKREFIANLRGKMPDPKKLNETEKELHARRRSLLEKRARIVFQFAECEKAKGELESLRSELGTVQIDEEKLLAFRADLGRTQTDQFEHLKTSSSIKEERARIKGEILNVEHNIKLAEVKLKRAEFDASTVDTVPCEGAGEFAKCQFLTRAIKAKAEIDPVIGEIDSLKAHKLHLDQRLKDTQPMDPAILSEFENRIREIKTRILEQEFKISKVTKVREKISLLESQVATADSLDEQRRDVNENMESVDTEIKKNAELLVLSEDIVREIHNIESGLSVDEDALDSAQSALDIKKNQLALAEGLCDKIQEARTRLDELSSRFSLANRDRMSYDILCKAFGKTGIQSLEIDSAGPEVSSIANDLLFSCFGPRFSIKFITQRPKAGGEEGYADDFDIYVLDAEKNREGSIDDLSGGEETIVNEAVSLAIALFNRRRSDSGWDTLFRDEVSGSLDDIRAPQYVSMLRKAREIGHFSKLFFIAHQGRVNELADSQLLVANGSVKVL